jgi:hypothetical protein
MLTAYATSASITSSDTGTISAIGTDGLLTGAISAPPIALFSAVGGLVAPKKWRRHVSPTFELEETQVQDRGMGNRDQTDED